MTTDLHVVGSPVGRLDNDLDPAFHQFPDLLGIERGPSFPHVDRLTANGHDLGPVRVEPLEPFILRRENSGTKLLGRPPPHPSKVKVVALVMRWFLL